MNALPAEVIPLRPPLMTVPPSPSPARDDVAIPYWPKLAKAIGRDQQLFLAQLDYWLCRSSNERDGRRWVYNTVDAWHEQFCDMSRSAVARTIASLKQQGIIESTAQYNTRFGDRTQWYTINYNHPALAPFLHLLKSRNTPKTPDTMPYPTNGISDIPSAAHTNPTNGTPKSQNRDLFKKKQETTTEITNNPPTPQRPQPKPQRVAVQYSDDFERLYALIPKKDLKMQAWYVWESLDPDAELAEQIIAAMQHQVRVNVRWQENNGQYCPSLKKWLDERRWEETPVAKPAAPNNPRQDLIDRLAYLNSVLAGAPCKPQDVSTMDPVRNKSWREYVAGQITNTENLLARLEAGR